MIRQKQNGNELNIANKSKKGFQGFSLAISFLLIFMLAAATITYSWVFTTQFSDITGVNIVLGESQGLVMTINGNVEESISINNYLGASFSTFSLKEASSANGTDLYLRDSGTYYIDTEGIYDAINVAEDSIGIIQFREAALEDQNDSFIYFYLTLESSGDNRYLIFDDVNSYIEDTGVDVNPIRVSLSFDDGTTTTTKIIGNRQEYTGNYSSSPISSVDSITKVGYEGTHDVESFAGYTGYDGPTFDSNRTLYHLQNGVQTDVIVRIWLEGGDPLCTNSIAGSLLDISLQFDNIADSEVV